MIIIIKNVINLKSIYIIRICYGQILKYSLISATTTLKAV